MGRPLIAVDSLQALANIAMEEYAAGIVEIEDPTRALLAPMIDARRMEVYTRLFDTALTPQGEAAAHILTSESFAEVFAAGRELLVFGNGAQSASTCSREPALPAWLPRREDWSHSPKPLSKPETSSTRPTTNPTTSKTSSSTRTDETS